MTRRVRIVKEVNAIEEKPRTVGNMAREQTPSIKVHVVEIHINLKDESLSRMERGLEGPQRVMGK